MGRKELILEQIHAGEIPANECTDSDRKERLAELDASDAAILAKYKTADMQALVAARLEFSEDIPYVHRGTFGFKVMKYAACAAVFCLVLMVPFFVKRDQGQLQGAVGSVMTLEDSVSTERAKGVGPRMYLYREENGEAVRLSNRTRAHEGDLIQISYIASGSKYGVILSIDGNGYVTQHYPENGYTAASLTNGGEIPLDSSYRLDDAPSFERFLLISSDEQFSVREVYEAVNSFQNAERAKSADFSDYLPKNVEVTDILLLK